MKKPLVNRGTCRVYLSAESQRTQSHPLAGLRKAALLSQLQVAEIVGVRATKINDIERGRVTPAPELEARLRDLYAARTSTSKTPHPNQGRNPHLNENY